jgi:hypothetical protein
MLRKIVFVVQFSSNHDHFTDSSFVSSLLPSSLFLFLLVCLMLPKQIIVDVLLPHLPFFPSSRLRFLSAYLEMRLKQEHTKITELLPNLTIGIIAIMFRIFGKQVSCFKGRSANRS